VKNVYKLNSATTLVNGYSVSTIRSVRASVSLLHSLLKTNSQLTKKQPHSDLQKRITRPGIKNLEMHPCPPYPGPYGLEKSKWLCRLRLSVVVGVDLYKVQNIVAQGVNV
jgi:hypothetical protein